MKTLLIISLLTLAALIDVSPVSACGVDTNCVIDDRHYRVRIPEGYNGDGYIGAIVFAHGYKGSAAALMKNKAMTAMASKLGIALIAAKSAEDDWSIPGAPSKVSNKGIDELMYFDRVIDDATKRFPIDSKRLIATGFSAGGMMVWNLACYRSQLFAGFIPISGTFWQPEPTVCNTPPANVIHIHGDADKTVPLIGRTVLDTHQGNVHDVLDMYASYGNYANVGKRNVGELNCQNKVNADGKILNFCMYSGGHSFKPEFIRQAWKMMEVIGKF